jgi:hypothetical protein
VKRRTRLPAVLVIFAPAAVVLCALLIGGAIQFENQDQNCASCHTEPETTYVGRSRAHAAVDLASAHGPLQSGQTGYGRCIDCHSGAGLLGRAESLTLGANNALKHYAGIARSPSVTTAPIADASCLKCHAPVLTAEGFDNHVHRFLPRWRERDAAGAATCAQCHSSHTTDGSASAGFLAQSRTLPQCDACHLALQAK